jgi:hypothetical protein
MLTERMASNPPAASGLIPLVIGVTGHRDLRDEDRPALTDSLRRLFRRLTTPHDPHLARRHRRAGHAHGAHVLRSPTPLLLLTPLAEGADRLVAHVALEFGARLVVPLPVPRTEYEQDFATPASRDEFAALLSPAHTVRVIDLPRVPAGHGEPLDAETHRLLQYTLAGAYVARHAQVFIALWDGEPPDKPGGTGDIVALRRTGRFAALPAELVARLADVPDPFALRDNPLGPPETGTVHHIVTPRQNRPVPAHAFAGRRLAPAEYDHPHQRHQYFSHLARAEYHMEAFNIEAAAAQVRDAARVAASADQLYPAVGPGATGTGLVAPLPDTLVPLRNAFALADTLALRYQRMTYRTFQWMFGLAFLAVALFEGYAALAEPGAGRTPWLLAYIALLAIADAVYLGARQRDVQNRFQDYRALAEGLRVQFYWRLSGLAHAASDFYLRQQRDELMWIAGALRAWGMWTPPLHGAAADARPADRLWIESQRRYFLDARPRSLAGLARDRSIGSGLIVASVGCALVAAAGRLAGITPRAAWVGVVALVFIAAMAVFAHHLSLSIHEAADELDEPPARSIIGPTERWLLVGVAIGVAAIPVARGASHLAAEHPSWQVTADWHAWFVMPLVLTALAGTLLHAYVEKRAFREHARRYRRMGNVFASAGRRLAELRERGERPEEWRGLILELGREALAEHGDWVLLHRERPVEPPRVDL